MKAPKPTNLYNLVYYVGKRKIETIMTRQHKALCRWKKSILSKSTHSKGQLKIEAV